MIYNKGIIAAKQLIDEFGIENPTDFTIEELIYIRNIILNEKHIANADGRIVFGKQNAIITINSDIKYLGRRRFTLAHELGHYELHHNKNSHLDDNSLTLDYFKEGNQEFEANQFATELLMPENIFKSFVINKKFSPDLLRNIAEYFQTSITSATFRYIDLGSHPIFAFYCHNNKVIYWKKSPNYYLKIKDIVKLSPPYDSVATEFFETGKIYRKEESIQEILKSTWFETNSYDANNVFFEYTIVTKEYNSVLSVVWEN